MEAHAAVLVCVTVLMGTLGRIAGLLPLLVAVSTKFLCVHVCLHVCLLCDSKWLHSLTACLCIHVRAHMQWLGTYTVHMEEWVCMGVCVSIHRVCACANGKVGHVCCCVCVCILCMLAVLYLVFEQDHL